MKKTAGNLVINKIIAILTENLMYTMEYYSTFPILHPSVFRPAARNGIPQRLPNRKAGVAE
jgi:hypothetical protein